MKKNFALLVAALGLSAALLTACTAPADSSQVTQPIASPDANAPANTKTSSVVSSQTADDAQPLPTAGESVSINTPQPTDVSGRITEADAKQIALDHAGVAEGDTQRLRVKLDYDDGVQEYEVTFYVGNREYDYDIDASTGTIRSFDSEIEDDYNIASAPSATPAAASASSGAAITEAEAKQIALDHAGVSESETERMRVKLGRDDGVQEYEVNFYVGNREYDYDINAATGEIRSHDSEIDDDYVSSTEAAGAAISEDEARATVVARVSGASASDVRLHLERDDGRLVYEGELIYNGTEYEFQIDAATGDVLDWESESVRD